LTSAAEFLQRIAALPNAEPTPMPSVIVRVNEAPRPVDAELQPAPPRERKRKLGKLELAIIVFLAFDVLVIASWRLFSSDASSADDVASVSDEPTVEPVLVPEPEAPVQVIAAEPLAPQPAPIEATPNPPLSVEQAIAAEFPPEPDSPGPIRPGGKSISDKVFREAMIAARDEMLKACLDSRMRRTLKIALKVTPGGQVEYARVLGSLGKTALGQCVVEHVYRIKFPITHEGGSHTYTLRLR
jgi:hypothetical protein